MPTWTTPPTWTSGQIVTTPELTVVSNDLTFLSQPPLAKLIGPAGGQVITTNTWTHVVGGSVAFSSGITTSTADEMIIVTPGKYEVTIKTRYNGALGATTQIGVACYQNGADAIDEYREVPAPGFGAAAATDTIICGTGDVLQLWTIQQTGGNYGLDFSATNSMTARWVSF